MRIAAVVLAALGLVVGLGRFAPTGAAELYTVARHDTLYSIARHFGVSVAALTAANNLGHASQIRIGQILVIPSSGDLPAPAFGRVPPPIKTAAVTSPLAQGSQAWGTPTASHEYVVHAGDTLYRIAKAYGLTVSALREANGLGDSTSLRVGEALIIPDAPVGRGGFSPDVQSSPPVDPQPSPPAAPPSAAAPVMPVPPGPVTKAPTAARGSLQSAVVVRLVTATALQYLGTPYAWGGTTRMGVDCSGLVYAVYSPYVPDLPRMSYDQWDAGVPVGMSALAPGDLVFFDTDGTGASHVGIYIGDGRFVHPSSSAGRVVIDELDEPYYLSHYVGARRLL